MGMSRIESVRGMSDVLSDSYEVYRAITTQLKHCFESFGYRPIEVPIVEHTELYLRKSGEEIVARMYDFVYQNRRLCLRPEMTASIIRAYVESLEKKAPLPVRLHYNGSVFRYERPQRAKYRQFTQIGVELIGSGGATPDAEVIWTACKSLRALGLSEYRLVIGHIGVLTRFLSDLNLGTRLENLLLSSMELLRQENGRPKVEQKLVEIYPDYQREASSDLDGNDPSNDPSNDPGEENRLEKLTEIFSHMQDEDARSAILDLLSSLNIDLKGNRSPEEIADRLLEKVKNRDRVPRIDLALQFMTELAALKGEPFEVLDQGKALLPKYGIDCQPLDELRAILEVLKLYDLDWDKVSLDLGLSRGLQYYTGTIFEIHHGSLGEERQLCGGGRYDDLVTTLGGKEITPATGFSFGLERLYLALEDEGKLEADRSSVPEVLVIALDSSEYAYAVTVAEQLRDKALRVELDVRDRNVSKNFQYAERQNFPFVIVVGSDERSRSEVTLRDRVSKEGKRMTVEAAATEILRSRK
jgi:histidyl-tRNA synthetase